MKTLQQISIRIIISAIASASLCAAVSTAHAQDLPIRVTPSSSAAPIPYLPFLGFTADGLRVLLGTDDVLIPVSVSISGSRIVATILMPVDRSTPFRSNSRSFAPIFAPGTYTIEVVERGVTVPERRSAPITVTVPSPTQASVPAFSVFDRKVKKFFLTASASDVSALVASNNTTTGPEWMPVEDNIRVWTSPQPFTVPVCRFFVPAAGVHFFSADEYNDCRKLRGLSGFTDEGTAFHVIPPYREPDNSQIGGPHGKFLNVCPVGTDPVYRMFDDSPGHPSHRYSTSASVVGNFVAMATVNGYRLEGVAFCSPRE